MPVTDRKLMANPLIIIYNNKRADIYLWVIIRRFNLRRCLHAPCGGEVQSTSHPSKAQPVYNSLTLCFTVGPNEPVKHTTTDQSCHLFPPSLSHASC